MYTRDFLFELPDALIAQAPLPARAMSRLLCLSDDGSMRDLGFADLANLLRHGDLLVFNDTRVIPARMLAHKETGGRIEIVIERIESDNLALAQVRGAARLRAGMTLRLEDQTTVTWVGREGEFSRLSFPEPVRTVLGRVGHVPLPPYIRRPDDVVDRERYQTVFARHEGAVAAPTASLHFDEAMLARLDALGVERHFVTLHVGAGTFQPVRTERVDDHRMHREFVRVPAATAEAVRRARAEGRRVVAIGTTVVRALETAASGGSVEACEGETEIFIRPGYTFRAVDALLTNFHLPGSTLLMLVCALGGTERVLAAYRHAVASRYRFFSYGDAMFVAATIGAR